MAAKKSKRVYAGQFNDLQSFNELRYFNKLEAQYVGAG